MNEKMEALIGDDKLVGAVLLVARNGRVEHHQALGYLNREEHTPMPLDAIFRIYSMTKPITSVALMMLVDQGKVQLDDTIADYLPAFSNLQILGDDGVYPSLTLPSIADILRHSAGFDYRIWETAVAALYRKHGVWDNEKSLAETIGVLATLPLSYEPGTSWQYSVSPDVSARIVEIVSGKPFNKYLEEQIFKPLRMVDTGYYVPKPKFGSIHCFIWWRRLGPKRDDGAAFKRSCPKRGASPDRNCGSQLRIKTTPSHSRRDRLSNNSN